MKIIQLLGIALLLAASAVHAQEKGITAYEEAIEVQADGSARVTTQVTLAGWEADRVDLPLNVAHLDKLAATIDRADARVAQAKAGDVKVVRVSVPGKLPAAAHVTVSYVAKDFIDWKKAKTARGVYRLSYTFANATGANIGKYRLQVRLPEGFGVSGITSSTPRATGEDVEPPYTFATVEGRTVLTLRAKSVGAGKNAAIAFGFQPTQRHATPVVVTALLVIALALYVKRDVLTKADFMKEAAA